MITGREIAHHEYRMARVAAQEAAPRLLANVTAKSLGAPFPFNKIDVGASTPAEKLSRPYAQSPWVQRAIQLKVGEITAVPVKFYTGESEYASPDFDAFWAAPFLAPAGKRYTLAEGQERLIGWCDLRGRAFILAGDDWLVPFPELTGSRLTPFIIASPDAMQPITATGHRGRGDIVGWVFTDPNGRRWNLLPEQVETIAYWNPYDENGALSPVEAIYNAAESDYLAGVYVRNLMRNNGDQGVYVVAKAGVNNDEQREQIVGQLREKRRAAARGDFRPVFLTGDITVEDAKAQVPDANLNNTRLLDRHTVFIGLGVPASMADVQASYSIGSDSDRARLVTGTCQALAKRINAPFGKLASRQTGKVLTAESDWDEHPVIQQIRRDRLELAQKLWATGMSWKVVNDQLDLGLKPFPGWDIPYLPFSVAPVEIGGAAPSREPEQDPALAEDDDTNASAPAKMIKLALLGRRRVQLRCEQVQQEAVRDEFALFECGCPAHLASSAGFNVARSSLTASQLAQWRTLMAKRRETINSFKGAIGRVLIQARIEVLRKIEAYQGKALAQRAAAADFLFDLAKFAAGFKDAIDKQHRSALKKAGQQLFEELGKDDPFSYPPAKAVEFIRNRENLLKDVPDEIHARIKQSLEAGVAAGETAAELAGRVKAEFNAIGDGRARTIGLTETGAAYGTARQEGMQQAGVQWKQWLTSGNANVRAAHRDASGQTVKADEPFNVDGEELMFPGDSSRGASAGNTINCHCTSIAVSEGPEEE